MNRTTRKAAQPRKHAALPQTAGLPEPFAGWFARNGWTPRPHQIDLLEKAESGASVLLIAPTGAGKTLAGFLPSLVDLARRTRRRPGTPPRGVHTLYISPLKALATDIARNLERPVAETGVSVTMETRTGDTSQVRRQRQKLKPPDILLTTPEQVALLIASKDARIFFSDLKYVIFDELHSLVTSKRGHLLSLGLARLRRLRPDIRTIGLSATVAEPDDLRRWLVAQHPGPQETAAPTRHDERDPPTLGQEIENGRASGLQCSHGEENAPCGGASDEGVGTASFAPPDRGRTLSDGRPAGLFAPAWRHGGPPPMSEFIVVEGGAKPDITILKSKERVPWQGHSSRYAMAEVFEAIRAHKTTLLFVNTRSQAEILFQELWRINDETLPIALHHGSLDLAQRKRVETAMSANQLRAVVATSTLDLGIDWGDVDLVVHVGAPKGASRLAQRIGRSNHRMDEPSKAILVPANRFEIMECQAALDANYLGHQDTPPLRDGALDVLAQHVLGMAVAEPFRADDLYCEIVTAAPYAGLTRSTFDRIVDFVATGGYSLRVYERYAKIKLTEDGTWRIAHPRIAQQYRMNAGTILEAEMLSIRLIRRRTRSGISRGGPTLGKIEENFLETLTQGDTFLFAGQVIRFEGIFENVCLVTKAVSDEPKIPYYGGSKFPLTTYLAKEVRAMLADPKRWKDLPGEVADWLQIQKLNSLIPGEDDLLVETFPNGKLDFMVLYPFEGRLAHQTLGMLLTRRLERARAKPLGFVATDYAISIWGRGGMGAMIADGRLSLDALFDEDMLGDDLEAWMADSWLLKRTFKQCAVISGLVDKRRPGQEKTGRQMTISTDLVYDVLRAHEPDHILMQATWADAATGLLDVGRVSGLLARVKHHIVHKDLDRISPLAVPIMLEVGRERVEGEARDELFAEAMDAEIAAKTVRR